MQSNFSVVTVSSGPPREDYYCYNEFFKSLHRYGHEPIVLGQNPGEFRGLGSKPKLLRKAILDGKVNTKYIIFADCYDLVFTGSPEEVMEFYSIFDSPFVCSAEKNCFPDNLKDAFPETSSSYKYLNSGFIVSDKDALLAILENMDLDNVPYDYYDEQNKCMVHINDQFLFHEQFIKQPVKMVLDYQQMLSQTMHQVKSHELEINNAMGIRNIETGMFPLTIHFNGSGKTDGLREPILKRLGL
jgi:hypothetical protein